MCSLPKFFSNHFSLPLLFDYLVLFLTPSHHRTLIFLFANFHTLFTQNNCLWNQVSTYLIQFPWQYGFDTLHFITLAPLTPFSTCRLATPLFPVSCHLLSSNDIGFLHNRAFINFRFMVLILQKM